MSAKEEFMRQWGVPGMPADKIRLANAAWDDAIKAEREECAKVCDERADTIAAGETWTALGAVEDCADSIRERSNVELRGDASRRPS